MRHGANWMDIQVRNISTRGLLFQTEDPPPPGTYIEIRRGPHIVVGRTIWRRGRSVGVRAQDRIDIDAIASHGAAPGSSERRSAARAAPRLSAADRAERSRIWSARGQFVLIALVALAAAGFAAAAVFDLLGRPFAAISAALSGSPSPP